MESTVKGETRRGGDDKERDYDDQESWFRMMLEICKKKELMLW